MSKVTECKVRVMISHEYNHFEVEETYVNEAGISSGDKVIHAFNVRNAAIELRDKHIFHERLEEVKAEINKKHAIYLEAKENFDKCNKDMELIDKDFINFKYQEIDPSDFIIPEEVNTMERLEVTRRVMVKHIVEKYGIVNYFPF